MTVYRITFPRETLELRAATEDEAWLRAAAARPTQLPTTVVAVREADAVVTLQEVLARERGPA